MNLYGFVSVYDNVNRIILEATIESFRLTVMYNTNIRIISSQAHGHGFGQEDIHLRLYHHKGSSIIIRKDI